MSRARPQRLRASLRTLKRSSVIWASGSLLASQALMAVYGVVTARPLGPSGKGIVTSILTWNQLLAWGSVAGLSTALGVGVASAGEGEPSLDAVREALGSAVAVTVGLGAVLVALASLVLPSALAHLGSNARSLTMLSLVTVPIQMLATLTLMVQLGLGRTKTYAWAQIVNPLTMSVLGAAFWVVTSHLTPFDVVVSGIAGGFISLAVSGWHLPWRSMRLSVAALGKDMSFGGKVHLGSLLRLTNLRLDYLIMSTILPAVQVGLYSVANSAMVPISTVPVVAATFLSPAIAALQQTEGVKSRHAQQLSIIRRKAKQYTLWASAGGGLICLCSPLLVPFALGNAFRGSVRLIWILTPGYVALCYNNIVAAGTAGMRRPWVGTIAEAVAVVVTVVLLALLLGPFGVEGAAVTSTAAYCVSALTAGVGFARLRRVDVPESDFGASTVSQPQESTS